MPAQATLPAAAARRPHALLVPFPSSGFINPMFHFARLLRSAGFVVTFVNTERNHALMLSRGRKRDGDGIRYEAIPDGLSPPERAGAQDDYGFGLLHAVRANGPGHLRGSSRASTPAAAAAAPVTRRRRPSRAWWRPS